jgi:phosphoheptose isomerase
VAAKSEGLGTLGIPADAFENAVADLIACFRRGGKLLVFGNGGSAADAQHLAAEFVGRFELDRQPLPAIALTTDSSALTAIANDFGYENVFARQVEALGRRGDVALAISTSGESPNVLHGVGAAAAAGMRTLGLVGDGASALARAVDVALVVRGATSAEVQEAQLVVEHELCRQVERRLGAAPAAAGGADGGPGRVVAWEPLLDERDQWRRAGLRVVWTNGAFDLLHQGHVRSLEAAKELGDVLVVGVNADETVRRLKGAGRPVVPAAQRAEVVAALRAVDRVVVFEEPTPELALDRLRPEVHAKGADYGDRPMPERSLVESYGGRVVLLPFVDGVSTTSLVSRLGG